MRKIIPLLICSLLVLTCVDSLENDVEDLQAQNAQQQALIDSLITVMSNQQTLMDSLNIAQQAYIDSLINLGNVSDSLLQVYTDSLNTVQNTYIDSLHNAQQATLEALANSALSAGFVETEVFSGTISSSWTDVDLSSAVGQFQSLVILKYEIIDIGSSNIYLRPNGSDFEYNEYDGINSLHIFLDEEFDNREGLVLITTDSLGIIEHKQWTGNSNNPTLLVSVVFYLNQ